MDKLLIIKMIEQVGHRYDDEREVESEYPGGMEPELIDKLADLIITIVEVQLAVKK